MKRSIITMMLAMAVSANMMAADPQRLVELLPLFKSADVPAKGADEAPTDGGPHGWMNPDKVTDPSWPGEGINRYPMIYIGESYKRICLVDDGKLIWSYDTGAKGGLGDIWMLKNGDVLFSCQTWAGKVTPDKKQVWRYDCKEGAEEIHTLQPIGDEEAIMLVNAFPARVVKFNHKTGDVLWEKEIEFNTDRTHVQSRRMRYTPDGTYLICHLNENRVDEYESDWGLIRTFDVPRPWAAIRLDNGNTLITLESERRTIEVDKNDNVVWEIKLEELPEPYRLKNCQSVTRLQNGNTILCSRGKAGNGPQLVEVTPDKEVIWVMDDWRFLGPATAVQILSEKGLSEVPGALNK